MDRGTDLEAVVRRAVEAAQSAPEEYRVAIAASIAGALAVERVTAGPQPPVDESRPSAERAVIDAPTVTLSEALSIFSSRPQTEQVLAIAAFHFRLGRKGVTRDEILAAYRDARLPLPGNLSETISRCIRKGWLSPEQRDGAAGVRVTQTGLRVVATSEAS